VLNKIKKLFMKKEEKDLQLDDLQMKANSEAIQADFDEITDEEIADAQQQLTDEVAVVDGATELTPNEEEMDELKNPSDYDEEYLEYSSEAVGFENREEQWNTYRTIVNYIGEGDSVLDFGCARGDFERFFETEFKEDLDYTGVDMNQQLIDAGNKVYNEEIELICSDWFNLDKDITADWSININSSNLRYDADTVRDDKTYLQDTIKCMMEHCEKGSVILLASNASGTDDGLINWDAGELVNWAQKEFGNVALDHTFSNDLFTLIIYKN
jgi:SAM-dependent methyltransferase